jgi:hypothetical protein
MDFLHCRTCGEIIRPIPGLPASEDEDLRDFQERHATCRVAVLTPTGRALADAPWHEPLAERRVEVAGDGEYALLVGRRASAEEAIHWTILSEGPVTEALEVELDAPAFWAAVDSALYPHHLPTELVRQWGDHLRQLVRTAAVEDLLVLDDDPDAPAVSHGCLTATASARVEASLRSFGFDETTEERLSSAFAGARFPPLRITRRLVTVSPGPGGGGEGRVSVGGAVPPAES